MEFDFVEHRLWVESSSIRTGEVRAVGLALEPQSVAEFYRKVMGALSEVGVEVKIWTRPCEVADPVKFEQDHVHVAYDADAVNKFWRSWFGSTRCSRNFAAGFLGKASPVHFFWGSFDLAVTRFSGGRRPNAPGADSITREAYSHEVEQRRVLAGRRQYQRAGILFLCRA